MTPQRRNALIYFALFVVVVIIIIFLLWRPVVFIGAAEAPFDAAAFMSSLRFLDSAGAFELDVVTFDPADPDATVDPPGSLVSMPLVGTASTTPPTVLGSFKLNEAISSALLSGVPLPPGTVYAERKTNLGTDVFVAVAPGAVPRVYFGVVGVSGKLTASNAVFRVSTPSRDFAGFFKPGLIPVTALTLGTDASSMYLTVVNHANATSGATASGTVPESSTARTIRFFSAPCAGAFGGTFLASTIQAGGLA